MLVDSVITSIL